MGHRQISGNGLHGPEHTHTHTHMHTNRTDCPTYTTKVVGNELHDAEIEYLRMAANKAQGVGLQ